MIPILQVLALEMVLRLQVHFGILCRKKSNPQAAIPCVRETNPERLGSGTQLVCFSCAGTWSWVLTQNLVCSKCSISAVKKKKKRRMPYPFRLYASLGRLGQPLSLAYDVSSMGWFWSCCQSPCPPSYYASGWLQFYFWNSTNKKSCSLTKCKYAQESKISSSDSYILLNLSFFDFSWEESLTKDI